MKGKHIILFLLSCTLFSCGPSDAERAQQLVDEARLMVEDGQWRNARFLLDSVHYTYPKEVAQRRLAKALEDSVVYLEAQATLQYADSMLPPLLEQADKLLKQFRYDKNDNYEDHGRYVHRLLSTGSNTSRNFLQAYVRDDRQTIVKSYYYGPKPMQQRAISLSANDEIERFSGSNHAFEMEGWHEVMTMEDESALRLLNFISAHMAARLRVGGEGEKPTQTWVYYLNDKEKEALSQTYQLGWLMKDIRRLEQMSNTANAQIARFHRKNPEQ